MRKIIIAFAALAAVNGAFAERQGPWTKERAWEWYNAQPWIRGCNYMPASCANRVDQWQEYGSEARFEEMEREMALMEKDGFNAVRIILGDMGFAVWRAEHDGMMKRFDRMLDIFGRHGVRVILVFGNDCSRPKPLWTLPKMGEQPWDLGYHGGRKLSQHGSFPGMIGYTVLDEPDLREEFFKMCEEFLTKYAHDKRILFWNLWNEPGNNSRGQVSAPHIRRLFKLAWKIDPDQPLSSDIWTTSGVNWTNGCAEAVGAELNDIESYHTYSNLKEQIAYAKKVKEYFGRPMVNTEWMARLFKCDIFDCYPFFAQNRIGCTMWGYVNGKYQTHEPWESMWKWVEADPAALEQLDFTKWFHDLYRPSLRPYDPNEIAIIRHINAQADAERQGGTVHAKIAKTHKILGEDLWYGYRRTKFEFEGHTAWVVEPSIAPKKGIPWTWTMQWAEAFVDRTGVPDLLKRGYHHVTIDLFDTRMNAKGLRIAASFQKFLVETLGFAPKANLIGMSWGGFFSTRYASTYPDNVAKIYLDAPLMNFDHFPHVAGGVPKEWFGETPAAGWTTSPEMPVNRAEPIAKAGIPILLAYGGEDQTVPPKYNCEIFIPRFQAAGGKLDLKKRGLFGHHPHGFDPDKTEVVVNFFGR